MSKEPYNLWMINHQKARCHHNPLILLSTLIFILLLNWPLISNITSLIAKDAKESNTLLLDLETTISLPEITS
jgi:hypothetical protein